MFVRPGYTVMLSSSKKKSLSSLLSTGKIASAPEVVLAPAKPYYCLWQRDRIAEEDLETSVLDRFEEKKIVSAFSSRQEES